VPIYEIIMTTFTTGDVSESQTLSDSDHLYPVLFNELRQCLTGSKNIVIAQTTTTGSVVDISRDLASGSTDSPVVTISQDNASDDQTVVKITNKGSGLALKVQGGNFCLEDEGTNETDLQIKSYNQGPVIHGYRSLGTMASPTALTGNQTGLALGMRPYTGSAYTEHSTAAMYFRTVGTQSPTNYGADIFFKTTPQNSTSRQDVLTLTSGGNVVTNRYLAIMNSNLKMPLQIGGFNKSGPVTTGTVPIGGMRIQSDDGSGVIDFGTRDGGHGWIQATDVSDFSIHYTIQLNPNGGNVYVGGNLGVGTGSPATSCELAETEVITGNATDSYSAGLTIDPAYSANSASSFTIARHNYIDVNNVTAANTGAGNLTVTDACLFRFDANAGTHKAVDSATTKSTPTEVDAWIKSNVNGTILYTPMYTSKTA